MFLINAFKAVINFLSAPQYLVTLMLIGVMLAIYWRPLWTRKGGVVLFARPGRRDRPVVPRSELRRGRDAARQRADHRDDLPRRLLLLVRDVPGVRERPPRHGRVGDGRRGGLGAEGVLLAGPRVRRADLPGRRDGGPDRVVHRAEGSARRAGQPDGLAQPGQGALVLPRPPGDARLLRPLARRRRLPGADHRGPDGDPLHRHQPQGERLLHVSRAQVGGLPLHSRVHRSVVLAHRAGDLPARSQLELLRPLRILGRQQARSLEQHQPLRDHLDQGLEEKHAELLALPRDLRPGDRRLLPAGASAGVLQDALPALLREDGDGPVSHRRQPRPDHGRASHQDVPALDLQPEVHRRRSPSSRSTSEHAAQAARRADRSPLQHPEAEPRLVLVGGDPDGGVPVDGDRRLQEGLEVDPADLPPAGPRQDDGGGREGPREGVRRGARQASRAARCRAAGGAGAPGHAGEAQQEVGGARPEDLRRRPGREVPEGLLRRRPLQLRG